MRYSAEAGERTFDIEINTDSSGDLLASLDRIPFPVDLQLVDGQSLYSLMVGNRSYGVFVDEDKGRFLVTIQGQLFEVIVRDEWAPVSQARVLPDTQGSAETTVKAPMPGMVTAIHVAEGDKVSRGTPLLILEAMKMENEIIAPREGTIARIQVQPGKRVGHGDSLLVIA